MKALEIVAYALDTLGFFLVTTDLYGRWTEAQPPSVRDAVQRSVNEASDVDGGHAMTIVAAPFSAAAAIALLMVAIFITEQGSDWAATFFGRFREPPWRELTLAHRSENLAVCVVLGAGAWYFAYRLSVRAFSGLLLAFSLASERYGFKRSLVVLGAVFFVSAKVLTIVGLNSEP